MTYCRTCGRELSYKKTENNRWMPCDALTGEKHFCQESKNNVDSGLVPCRICGKPTFIQKSGKKTIVMDYASLAPHSCMKRDVTNYGKYLERQKKKQAPKNIRSRKKTNLIPGKKEKD